MLSAMTLGSFASSPMILSAGGQDEHPCEVKSSTTARGSACAGRMIAMMAHTPSAPDHREIPEPIPFRLNRNGTPDFRFDAFSRREPVSTSLENALL